MKNQRSFWIALSLTLGVSGQSLAAEAGPSFSEIVKSINFKSFQIGGVYATQDSSSSGGGVIRYLPTYQLNRNWSAGISLDAAVLKLEDDKNFTAIGYMAFVRRKIHGSWDLQLNAGAQTWTCDDCSTKLVAGPIASYDLAIEKASWLKNVWVGYLPVFYEETVHEVQMGVGIQF